MDRPVVVADLTVARWSDARDEIVREIDESYSLSPLQQGMLFHSLHTPGPDPYCTQAHWCVNGELDLAAFAGAWQHVVDRHPSLRTSFHWERGHEPVQRVHRRVRVPVAIEDLRHLSEWERGQWLDEFLHADRARGFDVSRVPIMRVTVLQLGDSKYRIAWTGHHLLVDGRSMAIVIREVLTVYASSKRGMSDGLPPPTPFRQFISWIETQDSRAAESYWRGQLDGFAEPTSFRSGGYHADNLDPHAARTGEIEVLLEEGAERGLLRIARETGTTLNTVIMAAWAIMLGHASGRDDVVFGLTVGTASRGMSLSRSLVGVLINTLPLRVRIHPDQQLHALLPDLQSSLRDMRRYAYAPLVDIRRWSALGAGTMLFDTVVSFDNSSIDRLAIREAGLEVGRPSIVQDSNYPLNLVVRRSPSLSLRLIYHCPAFDDRYVALLARRLDNLLGAIARASGVRVVDLPTMPESELRTLTACETAASSPMRERCLHELFEAQVARTPDAPAVETMTYRELNRRANALARQLREQGAARAEVVVGLAVERSVDLVVGLVAIAKAGAACLLIDISYPPARIAFMVQDSGARLVLARRRLAHALPAGVPIVDVGEGQESGPHDDDNVESGSTPRALAYVVYTSGTSGAPKGVMVEHRSVANLVAWHTSAFGVSPQDRAGQISSPGFDAIIWEIWPYLAAGASLHVVPAEARLAPRRLQAWLLARGRISIMFLPTPLAEGVFALRWPKTTPLRTMLVGGDALRKAPPPGLPFDVVNNYGPSECTVVATSGPVRSAAEKDPITIGRPIANVEVCLLDDRQRPVPVGALGEIYIGGSGVARGYVNRPDLTREAFYAHPSRPGERLYRSGDLGRYLPDGRIEFVGRSDKQVQIRGMRVELGEIEAAITRHPDVHEAVAVAGNDGAGARCVVAYVVPRNGKGLEIGPLREFLRGTLPVSMLPTACVALPTLPMTTNGKVDRTALPPPTRNGWASSGPRDEVEQVLAAIWSDTLGIEGIGPGSDFFEMGGDSLLAVELLERVSVHFGDELEISDIFGTPTLGALAARLRHGHPPEASPLVPIRPLGCVLPFFCAAPVLGTVFPYYDLAHHLDPERPFYGLQPGCWPNEQGATVASLAAHYLPAVRRVQPEGPYHLGGWSFGGLVAFEMARQLKADGESVAATVLLDTPAPSERERLDLAEATRFILGTAGRGIAPYARDYEYLLDRTRRSQTGRGRRLSMSGFLRWIAERAAIAGIVPPESRLLLYHPPTVRQMVRSFRNGLVAGARYRPEPFEGRITLIRTSELGNPTMGWDRLARDGVDVRYVPGDHMSLLRQPHVAALARTLQVILDAREHDGAHHKTERAI